MSDLSAGGWSPRLSAMVLWALPAADWRAIAVVPLIGGAFYVAWGAWLLEAGLA